MSVGQPSQERTFRSTPAHAAPCAGRQRPRRGCRQRPECAQPGVGRHGAARGGTGPAYGRSGAKKSGRSGLGRCRVPCQPYRRQGEWGRRAAGARLARQTPNLTPNGAARPPARPPAGGGKGGLEGGRPQPARRAHGPAGAGKHTNSAGLGQRWHGRRRQAQERDGKQEASGQPPVCFGLMGH